MFVGIDISKDRLDVHLRPSAEIFTVARDGQGLEQLVARLATVGPELVVLEATGGFEITSRPRSPRPACRSRSSIRPRPRLRAVPSRRRSWRSSIPAEERHVESGRPGELLSADTLMAGTLKGIGRVYLHAVVDTFGS